MDKDKITLSIVERQTLINQFRILQKLANNDDEKKVYQDKIDILSSGYELHYQDALEDVDEDTLTPEECREVLNILEMFRGIIYSFQALIRDSKQGSLTAERVHFCGFDGNNETKQMLYARFFIKDLDRYSEIQELVGQQYDYNSHARMLPIYRQMLGTWSDYLQTLPNAYLMDEKQILQLINIYNPLF